MVDPGANPYAPPASELDAGGTLAQGQVELATPGTRLAAASLDGLLLAVPLVPTMGLAAWHAFRMFSAVRDAGLSAGMERHRPPPVTSFGTDMVLAALALGVLAALAISIYQWIRIARTGQSLGKKWMGARIERIDGAPVTFVSGVVLRGWVFGLVGVIPYVGWAFHVADCLCIFRGDRRCLHDHLAGTRVVRARRY